MIYCTTQPLRHYNGIGLKGLQLGLYSSYEDNPDLLALIMIGSLFPFEYEKGTKIYPQEKRTATLAMETHYADTLDNEINGVKVRKLLKKFNPVEFYKHIKELDLSDLKIVKIHGYNQELFKLAVSARATAWAMVTKGQRTNLTFQMVKDHRDVCRDIVRRHKDKGFEVR